MLPVSLQVLLLVRDFLQLYLSHVLCFYVQGNLIYDELLSVIVFSLRNDGLISVSSCGLSNASQEKRRPGDRYILLFPWLATLALLTSHQVRHLYICDFHKNFIQSVRNKKEGRQAGDGGDLLGMTLTFLR